MLTAENVSLPQKGKTTLAHKRGCPSGLVVKASEWLTGHPSLFVSVYLYIEMLDSPNDMSDDCKRDRLFQS